MAKKKPKTGSILYLAGLLIVTILVFGLYLFRKPATTIALPYTVDQIASQDREAERINDIIFSVKSQLNQIEKEDQIQNAGSNQREIEKLKSMLDLITTKYEDLLDLRFNGIAVNTQENSFNSMLSIVKRKDLASLDSQMSSLYSSLATEHSGLFASAVIAAGPIIPASVPAINQAPASGYRQQKVVTGGQSYLVDVIAADLNKTKVVVDTASDGTCNDNCPILSLSTFVNRSGAYAGINGTYFCPESYPSCASKKNSFDILVMNKNKVYFNSDNNLYSTVPAAIFSPGNARFVATSQEWGRDTSVEAVVANRPLLVLDGNLVFTGAGEPKEETRGPRSFLGASDKIVYIGVVRNASVAECARVVQTMGIKSAINLDGGGSVALWNGGYLLGPGRNIPNAILFIRR